MVNRCIIYNLILLPGEKNPRQIEIEIDGIVYTSIEICTDSRVCDSIVSQIITLARSKTIALSTSLMTDPHHSQRRIRTLALTHILTLTLDLTLNPLLPEGYPTCKSTL